MGVTRFWLLLVAAALPFAGGRHAGVAALSLAPDTVVGGVPSVGTVKLDAPAPVGGALVALSSSDAAAKVPASVTVPAGQSSATFDVATKNVPAQVLARITAGVGDAKQTAAIIVNPVSLASSTLTAVTLVGGNPTVGTLTLTGPAPAGGLKIQIASSDPAVKVPATVVIPAGTLATTFPIVTKAILARVDVTISATLGYIATTSVLTVYPLGPAFVSFAPTAVPGGSPATATVNLTAPAPKGGMTVSLAANNRAATIPSSVTVLEGKTTADFPIKTRIVPASTPVTITAKFGNVEQGGTLTIQPPTITSFVLTPTTLIGGASSNGKVTVSQPAPPGGLLIKFVGDPTVTVPASVVIPAGKLSCTMKLTTVAVAATKVVNVQANLNGAATPSPLTVSGPTLVSIVLKPDSVAGGGEPFATVTLSSPAPAGGLPIPLTSSVPAVVVPKDFTIVEGRKSGYFRLRTPKVKAPTPVVLTATLAGVAKTATLTVK